MLDGNYGKVFTFIQDFHGEYHFPPTYKEIADGCGISVTTVVKCVVMLERRGYLARDEGKRRAIRIVKMG